MPNSIKYIEPADFLKKTIELVNQYTGPLSTTIFLNACVGLLFTATSKYADYLKTIGNDFLVSNQVDADAITICKRWNRVDRQLVEEDKTVYNICRHLRNSIAHCNFRPIKGNRNTIYKIHFTDKQYDDITFDFEMDISTFRNFISAVAAEVAKQQ